MTKTHNNIKKLAILAGSGMLPVQVAKSAKKDGLEFLVIGLNNITNHDLFDGIEVHSFEPYKISKILKFLKSQEVSTITMAGYVKRSELSRLIFDLKGAKLLAKILRNGLADNSLLLSIIEFLESEKFEVIGPETIAYDNIARRGVIGSIKPKDNALKDIKQGCKVLKVISETDVGQAVVIQSGLILGVEAAEGTDMLIKRCGEIRQKEEEGPILIKMCKPSQDLRIDLPCIGPTTIEFAAKYGFAGIAIEADNTLIVDLKHTIALANQLDVFVYGY